MTKTTKTSSLVALPDLFFRSAGLAAQWRECEEDRAAYAYIMPFPTDPQYPTIYFWFSNTKFTPDELAALCEGSDEPLQVREQAGEPRLGFAWPLTDVQIRPRTHRGRWLQRQTLLQ